jgi:DNA-binding NarL/FixJ family response regulator
MPPSTRVLIADPNKAAALRLNALLNQRPDFQTIIAGDGADAFNSATADRPQIAILGHDLDAFDGPELMQRVKHVSSQTLVIFYTRSISREALWEVLRAGARGYVHKSEPESQVLEAIHSVSQGKPYLCGQARELLLAHVTGAARTLTESEIKVIQLICEGRTIAQMAKDLAIAPSTVDARRKSAMQKLQLRTRPELIRFAMRTGLA